MLLKTEDGIACDRCGRIIQTQFTYYSYDFRELQVVHNVLPEVEFNTKPIFSVDICESCMVDIAEKVKRTYKPFRMLPSRLCPQGISCDLTGRNLTGTFRLYHCTITKVTVDTKSTRIVCRQCGAIQNSDHPCTKCNSTDLVRQADMKAENRWLELYVSEAVYEEFKARVITLRQTPEDQKWSASST